jgi:thiol:disulfide interchange protein DsbD
MFYVLGMSVTYSVLGLVAALTGGVFGSLLQSPIVVGILVLIFIALALSMFGLYEIKIPQSIANFSGKNRQGYFGTFLMGLTVGFIAAPCIGPLVLSLLVYVGQMGSPFLGFIMFFVLSLGLGVPYVFLAIFSSSITKLPRSGEWMEGVKIIFGLMMIGLALYTAQPLMSSNIYEIIFPLFLVLAGAYLILIDRKAITAPTYTRIKYLIAIAAIVWGAMNLHFGEQQVVGTGKYEWQMLQTQAQIDLSVGKSTDKPTIIDFYADWCAQCKELDKYTYIDPKVIELSKKFNNIKVDLTKGDKDIEGKFKIQGLPVVSFIDKNGKEMEDLRITGFLKPDEFVKVMEKALSR